ncbi:Major facilitator superfamily [Dillenia turbinata]|uniref:Major facilitator superfamily n=1 Tax=Dillenia turbinata TaxID=194707 RepID=A0AAN8UJT2_9MAGN
MGSLRHLYVTLFLSCYSTFMVIPAITDVTMLALCPGKDQCSLAIYLSGFQQAIIGVGSIVMMPLIGNLSDVYGRKALLTLPMTVSIIPLAILAYSRTTRFFYVYFVFKTLTSMVSEGSVQCLALAYVADSVSEEERISAFGFIAGIASAAFVVGTLTTRFISTTTTFQVATLLSMLAAVYMRIFLKETRKHNDVSTKAKDETSDTLLDENSSENMQVFKKFPSVEDLLCLLRSSSTFSQAAIVALFSSLADGGMQASLMYFFKARFGFNKDQFADIMLIVGVAGTVSQVPYAAAVLCLFGYFAPPCLRSIISKQVGPNDQGKAQGCISGISSFANIVSPLIFSPLTALFLSERAPFNFPGFSILCIGLASLMAFIQSLIIRTKSPSETPEGPTCNDC